MHRSISVLFKRILRCGLYTRFQLVLLVMAVILHVNVFVHSTGWECHAWHWILYLVVACSVADYCSKIVTHIHPGTSLLRDTIDVPTYLSASPLTKGSRFHLSVRDTPRAHNLRLGLHTSAPTTQMFLMQQPRTVLVPVCICQEQEKVPRASSAAWCLNVISSWLCVFRACICDT